MNKIREYTNTEIQKRIHQCLSQFTLAELLVYCDREYSNNVFGLNFPLLFKVKACSNEQEKNKAIKDARGYNRWTWKYTIQRDGFEFALCTQWYEWNDRKVKIWLNSNES